MRSCSRPHYRCRPVDRREPHRRSGCRLEPLPDRGPPRLDRVLPPFKTGTGRSLVLSPSPFRREDRRLSFYVINSINRRMASFARAAAGAVRRGWSGVTDHVGGRRYSFVGVSVTRHPPSGRTVASIRAMTSTTLAEPRSCRASTARPTVPAVLHPKGGMGHLRSGHANELTCTHGRLAWRKSRVGL